MGNAKEETMKYAAERAAIMEAKGFVSVARAAELVKHPRSNIFHWIRAGQFKVETWGAGKGSVYVALADLQRKFPAAFPGQVTAAAPLPPARREVRAARKRSAPKAAPRGTRRSAG